MLDLEGVLMVFLLVIHFDLIDEVSIHLLNVVQRGTNLWMHRSSYLFEGTLNYLQELLLVDFLILVLKLLILFLLIDHMHLVPWQGIEIVHILVAVTKALVLVGVKHKILSIILAFGPQLLFLNHSD